jgi:hypothetical protein
MKKWVVCLSGNGFLLKNDVKEKYESTFDINSIGLIKKEYDNNNFLIWFIGDDTYRIIPKTSIKEIDINETGDKYPNKICNICHRLLPIKEFDRNQNNLHGIIRRPSCRRCRTSIDKRAP